MSRALFPSQLTYEVTSVTLADDWLLVQKAGELKQGKLHPSNLGFAPLSGATFTGILQRDGGFYLTGAGLSSTAPIYAFEDDQNTGIGTSTSDQVNVIAGGATVAAFNGTNGSTRTLLPQTDNTYDLGSATYAWKDVYIDGTTVAGPIRPVANNSHDLGDTTYKWQDLWLAGYAYFGSSAVGITTSSSGLTFQTGSLLRCSIDSSGHFVPASDNAYDLGNATYAWRNMYIDGTTVANVIRPVADDLGGATLGTSSYYWSAAYISDVYMTGNVSLLESGGSLIIQTASASKIGINTSGELFPMTDNLQDCGISTKRWDDIWATNNVIQTSDANDKDEIADTDLGLDFITRLRPVSFRWKKANRRIEEEDGTKKVVEVPGTRRHYGLLAQDLPQALNGKDFAGYCYDPDADLHALRYTEFIAPMIKAIQELSAKVELLEAALAGNDKK